MNIAFTFTALTAALVIGHSQAFAQSPPVQQSGGVTRSAGARFEALSSDQRVLLGELGFGALTLDAYYRILSSGNGPPNNLLGVDNVTREKLGVSFSEALPQLQKLTGRDIPAEAEKMVRAAIDKLGGLQSDRMKKWVELFTNIHMANLQKLQEVK